MGQKPSTSSTNRPQDLEYYVIRLEADQSVLLYGLLFAKTTLTWKDVLQHAGITLKSCCECGIDRHKLCRMQPDIREWMRNGKAKLDDCAYMDAWKPHVFNDLGCSLGDLVIYRKSLGPELLWNADITFDMLHDKYGLTPELMVLLRYSCGDWLRLRVSERFLNELTDEQWTRIFGSLQNRREVVEMAQRYTLCDKKNA
jgi:hypothetical protein